MANKYIKKVITVKGQEMWFYGDGLWFGRTSKVNALEKLNSGEFKVWSVVDKATNTEIIGAKLNELGELVTGEEKINDVESTKTVVPVEEIVEVKITNSENSALQDKQFKTIYDAEKTINKTINRSKLYCTKIWLEILIPNSNGHTFSFKCEPLKGTKVNLSAYCMQCLKSSLAFTADIKEREKLQKLLKMCEMIWGISTPSDCATPLYAMPKLQSKHS